ncbi:MAG: hypothetical protein WA915_06985 [Candidatus Aminicenantaceae bacterium]
MQYKLDEFRVRKEYDLNYSRVEANPPHPNNKVEAVAHEAVVIYCEPTQPTRATTKAS